MIDSPVVVGDKVRNLGNHHGYGKVGTVERILGDKVVLKGDNNDTFDTLMSLLMQEFELVSEAPTAKEPSLIAEFKVHNIDREVLNNVIQSCGYTVVANTLGLSIRLDEVMVYWGIEKPSRGFRATKDISEFSLPHLGRINRPTTPKVDNSHFKDHPLVKHYLEIRDERATLAGGIMNMEGELEKRKKQLLDLDTAQEHLRNAIPREFRPTELRDGPVNG